MRYLPLFVAALMLLSGAAQAAEPEPTRHILIRAWRGDTLVFESPVALIAGHPTTIKFGDGGLKVPEGMVPPPLKVFLLASVQLLGSEVSGQQTSLDPTDVALASANHFIVGDIELRILTRDADRFAAVVFDQLATAEQAITLPPELAFTENDADFTPAGVITAWVSGSLVPMKEPVLIDRAPQPASITLPATAAE
jgi:hypothetical protein